MGSRPRRGGRPSRPAAFVAFQFRLSPVRRLRCSRAAMAARRTLGEADRARAGRPGGNLRRLLRRAMVAARRGSHQPRRSDPVAGGSDRGQYRPRQYGRSRRHPDRTCRQDPDRGAHPRYHRSGSRPRHRRERAESGSETVRYGAVDGAASGRKPQSGRCGIVGPDHARRQCDRFRRRYRETAGDRRCLEARGWPGADLPAADFGIAAAWNGGARHGTGGS